MERYMSNAMYRKCCVNNLVLFSLSVMFCTLQCVYWLHCPVDSCYALVTVHLSLGQAIHGCRCGMSHVIVVVVGTAVPPTPLFLLLTLPFSFPPISLLLFS